MEYRDYKGYDIAIRKTDTGMYELATMAVSMGDEYRVSMLADTLDDSTPDKFINYVEKTK